MGKIFIMSSPLSYVRLVRMPSTLRLKPLPYAGTVDDAPSGDALQGHAKGKVGGG